MSNQPTWTKTCRCGAEVSRWTGEAYPSCPNCGADYNAFGQRLRDGWQGNMSNYDDEVGDMEGYEAQQVEADEFYESQARGAAEAQARTTAASGEAVIDCDYPVTDGNVDDPTYAFCGHPRGHAGDHGNWRM